MHDVLFAFLVKSRANSTAALLVCIVGYGKQVHYLSIISLLLLSMRTAAGYVLHIRKSDNLFSRVFMTVRHSSTRVREREKDGGGREKETEELRIHTICRNCKAVRGEIWIFSCVSPQQFDPTAELDDAARNFSCRPCFMCIHSRACGLGVQAASHDW